MSNKLPKFKHSDQFNAANRDSKKSRKIRGGAKNSTHSYAHHPYDDEEGDFSPPSSLNSESTV